MAGGGSAGYQQRGDPGRAGGWRGSGCGVPLGLGGSLCVGVLGWDPSGGGGGGGCAVGVHLCSGAAVRVR